MRALAAATPRRIAGAIAAREAGDVEMIAMRPFATPFPDSCRLLPGADYADSFRLVVSGQSLDAFTATERVMGRAPGWIGRLMSLRNALVKPFGLKTEPGESPGEARRIGTFPLISRTPERVVLGLDDRHLDFRVCVDVETLGDGRQAITASTEVKTHNALGRAYLAVVKPFHRMIVPAMLAQAARA
jgi:hypothetical protein